MQRIVITNEETGNIEFDQVAQNFIVLTQNGPAFSKSGFPNDLILQLGMLHFALSQIQAELNKQNAPLKLGERK